MRKLIASLVLAVMTITPAFAWGDREQGILAGVAGLYLLQKIGAVGSPTPPVQAPAPSYGYAPPVVVPHSYTYRPMYRMVDVFIPECNCYRSILVQIN